MNSGIYLIKNNINNKVYVGSASSFKKRWETHKRLLNNNKHHSIHLQNAWNKFGENNFTFLILEQCLKEILLSREQYYLDTLKPEYNICKVAGRTVGYKHNIQALNKIKENSSGENNTNATLTWKLVNEMRNIYKNDQKILYCDLCSKFNVNAQNISFIIRNKTWFDPKYIPPEKHKRKTKQVIKKNLKRYDDLIIKEIRKIYKETNLTTKELSIKFSIPLSYIVKIVSNLTHFDSTYNSILTKEQFIQKIKGKHHKRNDNFVFSEKIEQEIIEKKLNGISQEKIAKFFNVKRGIIRKIISNYYLKKTTINKTGELKDGILE